MICAALAACGGVMDARRTPPSAPPDEAPVSSAAPNPVTTLGSGSVKVALILPLTGSAQGAAAAASLRNAAELAMTEFQGADLALLVKDDRGNADGARAAAASAIAEGAELIVGPLFAPAVAAAGTVAKERQKPIVAFSTDTGVASRGIYLLSFLPQTEVSRVLDHAAAQGRRSIAGLIPDTTYGSVAEAEFRESAARRGIRVVALERYAAGQAAAAADRLASVLTGQRPAADAILIPAPVEDLPAIGAALQKAGFDPARTKPLGTGLWNDPRAARVPALQTGWYASPDPSGYRAFSERYRARFGTEPVRIATLAYDAVSLAAALARNPAATRFADAAIEAPSGFAGADGAFRFRADGTNLRALAVSEIRPDGPVVVSPAPRTLAGPGL